MKYARRSVLTLVAYLSISVTAMGQLVVAPNQTALVLASKLAGPGITIASPTLTCAGAANGTFVSTSTPITIDSGIVLTSGRAANTSGTESFLASTNNGTAGDAALTALAGTATHDACVLEFDFTPNGDTVSFNYQFGSEEYVNSTCGQYNDAFAFYISGPGIAGAQNMALVPGTTIPVTVNSINNGVPGPAGYPGYCNIAYCTGMGPGSPFTSYYYDNTGGTQVTYKGYTKRLAAVHSVIPCNTYHLKIAVADAANSLYDSGVFIEAGSLKTNSYSFSHADSIGTTINGVPHSIVKGCSPAVVKIVSAHSSTTDQTVHFMFGGTAVQNVDFNAPDSAVIAAGDTTVIINIIGLPTAVTGTTTLEVYLVSPFSCGIADSIALNILDSPTVSILTPDTTVCAGVPFVIRTTGTTGLTYTWFPATGLSDPFTMQPTATLTAATSYTVSAILPGSGCVPISRSINISVITNTVTILTPDTTICNGASVHILVSGSTGLDYSWSPGTGLDNASIQNPTASPAATTTYTVTAATPGGCPATGHITITVADPAITILTPDTSICAGASVNIRVVGNPTYTYSWTPAATLDNAGIISPVASPTETTTYVLTALVPGTTCSVTKQVGITIFPPIPADAGPYKQACTTLPLQFAASPDGTHYSYQWSGPDGFSSNEQEFTIHSAVVANTGIYTLIVTDNNTTCTAQDTTSVSVNDAAIKLTNVTRDQTIPYGSSIQLNADNALYFTWTPNDGSLSNPNINNPVATPLAPTTYTVYGINIYGCRDTESVVINITFDTVFIPSAFTPNNDGLNDRFRVVNLGFYKLVEMSVFNRWGTVVYHTVSGENRGWDGTYNGQPQDMGTYNYMVIISKPDGTDQVLKGEVTLVR